MANDNTDGPLLVQPIIHYPAKGYVGERYLMTVDLRLAEHSPWPFEKEEIEIALLLDTAPFYAHESPELGGQEGLVLHRFGGTYGHAEWILTAADHPVPAGTIRIVFLWGWSGLPMLVVEQPCEIENRPND